MDSLKAQIALKRKTLEGEGLERPMKYMKKGDIEKLRLKQQEEEEEKQTKERMEKERDKDAQTQAQKVRLLESETYLIYVHLMVFRTLHRR